MNQNGLRLFLLFTLMLFGLELEAPFLRNVHLQVQQTRAGRKVEPISINRK